MTDEQIVKALECCGNMNECKKECPLDDLGGIDKCIHTLMLNALALIKRQQAEIESLEADYENVYKQATADILASIADGGTSCEWCIDKHRTEAVREFAVKYKTEVTNRYEDIAYKDLFFGVIDNLVKEMTEKEGGMDEISIDKHSAEMV